MHKSHTYIYTHINHKSTYCHTITKKRILLDLDKLTAHLGLYFPLLSGVHLFFWYSPFSVYREKVIWSDYSSFTMFSKSGWLHVWQSPTESFEPKWLTPTVRKAICWHDFVTLVSLMGRVISDQCKVVLSDHLCPVIKPLYPEVVSSRMTVPPSTGRGGTEWFHCDQMSSQLNTSRNFWTNKLDCSGVTCWTDA